MPPRRALYLAGLGALLALIVFGARAGLALRLHEPPPPAASTVTSSLISAPGLHCASIRTVNWSPLPGVEYTGRLGIQLPANGLGEMLLVVGDSLPVDLEVETESGAHVPAKIEPLGIGVGRMAPPPDYWLEDGTPFDAPAHTSRVVLAAFGSMDRVLSVRLGRRAPRVLARLRGYPDDGRALVCAAPLGVEDAFAAGERVREILPAAGEYFGAGWSGVMQQGSTAIRRMHSDGVVLVPSATRAAVRIVLQATTAADGEIALRVNEVGKEEGRPLRNGSARYAWDVPATQWLQGTNELHFRVNGASGLDLQRLTLLVQQ